MVIITFKHIACILIYLLTIFLFVKLAFVFIAGSGSLAIWIFLSFKIVLELPYWSKFHLRNTVTSCQSLYLRWITGKQKLKQVGTDYYFIKPNNCFASSKQTNITVVWRNVVIRRRAWQSYYDSSCVEKITKWLYLCCLLRGVPNF